jgi:tryptophan synthase alpha subunit
MSRISEAFANLKRQNRKGFIPFITREILTFALHAS